jgi:heme/copper-type cytochrome/quinol oxidase subunit 2
MVVTLIVAGAGAPRSQEPYDTSHGFHIDGTSIGAVVPKRGQGEARVRVRLERPGRYEFACTRMCGAGHDFMRGVLIVADRPAGAERP